MNYEIDFLPIGEGSGDAIVIRYGDDTEGHYLHVVDGGALKQRQRSSTTSTSSTLAITSAIWCCRTRMTITLPDLLE